MMRTAAPVAAMVVFSAVAHALVIVTISGEGVQLELHYSEAYFLWIFLGLSAGASLYQSLTDSRRRVRIALVAHGLIFLALQTFLLELPTIEMMLGLSIVLAVSIYEPHPGNQWSAVAIGVVATANRMRMVLDDAAVEVSVISLHLVPGLILCVVGVAVAQMTRYRELLISTQRGYNRLDRTIGQLSRLNQEYQDSLIRVESESMESERKRITRDIHDVVGYTLTNNIMLMEAATDMARLNPLGVTRMLSEARENAQEGLRRVRETLYGLRERHDTTPQGPSAVSKLVKTFHAATGIIVDTHFTNVPLQLPPMVDFTLYHIVQEAMINAYRHGEASRIWIILSVTDGMLEITVKDNGKGAKAVEAGIGLQGMLERVTRLGGCLRWSAATDGFSIEATLPMRRRSDEREDSSSVDRRSESLR